MNIYLNGYVPINIFEYAPIFIFRCVDIILINNQIFIVNILMRDHIIPHKNR